MNLQGFDVAFWRRTIERSIVFPGAIAVKHIGDFGLQRDYFRERATGWQDAQADQAKADAMMARVGVSLGLVLAEAKGRQSGGVFYEIEELELIRYADSGDFIRGLIAYSKAGV